MKLELTYWIHSCLLLTKNRVCPLDIFRLSWSLYGLMPHWRIHTSKFIHRNIFYPQKKEHWSKLINVFHAKQWYQYNTSSFIFLLSLNKFFFQFNHKWLKLGDVILEKHDVTLDVYKRKYIKRYFLRWWRQIGRWSRNGRRLESRTRS